MSNQNSCIRSGRLYLCPALVAWTMWPCVAEENFRIDFFPSVHYTKDPADIHLKLSQKPSNPVLMEQTANGPVIKELDVDEKGVIAFKLSPGSLLKTSRVRVFVKDGPALKFRLLRAYEGLPAIEARDGHFYDSEGTLCLLLAEFQSKPPNRRWQPIRWAAGFFMTGIPPKKTYVISEFHGQERRTESISPLQEAILRVAEFSEFKPKESVTIHLGSRDIPLQTSPAFLRLNLEVILQHLIFKGAKDIRLALPIGSPVYKARLKAFKNVIRKLGHDYAARRVFDVTWYMDDELWLMPGTKKIFRKEPSMKLQEQIERVLQAEGMRKL